MQICSVKRLAIKVADSADGTVPGFLHLPQNHDHSQTPNRSLTAAILLSGAGGGVVGPSSIYLSIATKLASLTPGIPVLRLDYRQPARTAPCVHDVQAAMNHLEREHAVSRFVLVGWSFGGAPVFTVAGGDARVVGCATVASQTAGTEGVARVAPRPVLLLHGTADRTLSPECSRRLYGAYGTGGERVIRLFEGDDHALTRNSGVVEELLCRFVVRLAGVRGGDGDGERGVLGESLVGEEEKVELMRKGGDLRGGERVE